MRMMIKPATRRGHPSQNLRVLSYRHKAVGRQAQLLATRPKTKMERGLCILRGEATKFKIGQMAVHITTQHQADPEYNEMIEMLQESKIVEDCAECGHKKPTSTQGEKHHARPSPLLQAVSNCGRARVLSSMAAHALVQCVSNQ